VKGANNGPAATSAMTLSTARAGEARAGGPAFGEYEGSWLQRRETCNAVGAVLGDRLPANFLLQVLIQSAVGHVAPLISLR
jgi:hypothetical protein